jgi:2-polyprenyl-3-methyl-5-hydroxy-6-metoxy-1,4-benzoquinol methylase
MSLLMNALRTAFGAVRTQNAPPGEGFAAVANDPGPPASGEMPSDDEPVWRLLGAQMGVQEISYLDKPRPGVQALFGHAPRRLLDIGCAAGATAADLKRQDPALWAWGCELSPEAAAIAATRLDHVTAVARPEWNAEDVAQVRTVDTVLLLDVLEHMFNPWAELEFLAAHLPQHAQVVVSLPNVGHLSVLEALAKGTFPYAATGILDVTHMRFFGLAEMLAMFDQTGFAVEETRILTRTSYMQIDTFPARISTGDLTLTVQSAEHWDRLNAVQYGFRLRPRPRTGTSA